MVPNDARPKFWWYTSFEEESCSFGLGLAFEKDNSFLKWRSDRGYEWVEEGEIAQAVEGVTNLADGIEDVRAVIRAMNHGRTFRSKTDNLTDVVENALGHSCRREVKRCILPSEEKAETFDLEISGPKCSAPESDCVSFVDYDSNWAEGELRRCPQLCVEGRREDFGPHSGNIVLVEGL